MSVFSPISPISLFDHSILDPYSEKIGSASIEEAPFYSDTGRRKVEMMKQVNDASDGLVFSSEPLVLCARMFDADGTYLGDVQLKRNESHIEFLSNIRSAPIGWQDK